MEENGPRPIYSPVLEGIDLIIGRLIVVAGEQLAKGERGKALDLLSVLVLAKQVRDEHLGDAS